MATDDKRAATANVVSIKTGKALVTADKAEVKTARLVVRKEHTPPKRQTVENPLTTEQKSELKELINEWVSCRALVKKPIAYGAAFARLYSEHLSGQVEHLYEIESCEFPGCKNWINQQIRITENINEKKASLNPEYAKSRKTTIMARCRQLGISDAIRKQYMIDR